MSKSRTARAGSRLAGAAAVLALALGGLAATVGPADAATRAAATPADSPCDPVGNINLAPVSITLGGQVTVQWTTRGLTGCNPAITSVLMSGPGFDSPEQVSASGSRTVTPTQAGTAVWTLDVATRLGQTQLDQQSTTVNPPPPVVNGLAGGAVGFADSSGTETKAETNSITASSGLHVMSGTNPSLYNVGQDYEGAYQGTNGDLWIVDSAGTATDLGLGMAAGTSPSITTTGGTNFAVAFQANTGQLWLYRSQTGAASLKLPMAPGTSPSATLTRSGVAVAYVGQNGKLSVFDPVLGFGGYTAPVAPGTSPAITFVVGGDSYRIAYQAPDHTLRTTDSTTAQTFATGQTMATGSSPAMTTLSGNQTVIAFGGSDGTIRTLSSTGAVTGTNAQFLAGTSPSIAPAAGGGVVAVWDDINSHLGTFVTGTGVTPTPLVMAGGSSPSMAQIDNGVR
ncbi:hypothetical protein ABH935_003488 [Catenulispora sp. GAS73]|uniref:hypothetical protein n=1 Tax=Catenulispora sp. GAS73 TaxID=3156269 RepID=UPI0035110EDB